MLSHAELGIAYSCPGWSLFPHMHVGHPPLLDPQFSNDFQPISKMATPWYIRVRRDLHTDVRVLRIAQEIERHCNLSQIQFEGQTRLSATALIRDVTIAGLVRVWAHANDQTSDGVFQHVTGLDFIDLLAGLPGFGDAMAVVGWAKFNIEKQTIELPNFLKWNTPAKSGKRGGRPGNPNSAAAIRKRSQRDKARADQPRDNPVTTEGQGVRHRDIGKGRVIEEDRKYPLADAIAGAYPRKDAPLEVLAVITADIDNGEDGPAMLDAVNQIAAKIQKAPGGSSNRYVPTAKSFFRGRQWRSPEAFDHRWTAPPEMKKEKPVILTIPTKGGW